MRLLYRDGKLTGCSSRDPTRDTANGPSTGEGCRRSRRSTPSAWPPGAWPRSRRPKVRGPGPPARRECCSPETSPGPASGSRSDAYDSAESSCVPPSSVFYSRLLEIPPCETVPTYNTARFTRKTKVFRVFFCQNHYNHACSGTSRADSVVVSLHAGDPSAMTATTWPSRSM